MIRFLSITSSKPGPAGSSPRFIISTEESPGRLDEVLKRRDEILAAGFVWSVVESIPIHNSIKLRSGPYARFIDAWKDTLTAVAKAGVQVVCYNFMPVVDWTRTDLKWRLPTTGYALRFDVVDFAAYDMFILRRKGAEADYSEDRVQVGTNPFRFDVGGTQK